MKKKSDFMVHGLLARRAVRAAVEKARDKAAAGPPRVSEWARTALGFEPDETQARVMDSGARRGILLCTRQWGKSTVAAAMAAHTAAFTPGSTTVILGPTLKHSGETLEKCAQFFARLGWRRRGDGNNPRSLRAPNGSRVIGLPGTEVGSRGYSAPALLIVDEAAMVEDATFHAATPMLSANPEARLWLMSTPQGVSGFFYKAWTSRNREWVKEKVTAEECARIERAFLEEERERLGERMYRQEYLCEFTGAATAFIPADLVDAALVSGWPWRRAA